MTAATRPTREGTRRRLGLVERLLPFLSLRPERGKARRGVLASDDLSTLEQGFGISAAWVLTGDTRALGASLIAFSREWRAAA